MHVRKGTFGCLFFVLAFLVYIGGPVYRKLGSGIFYTTLTEYLCLFFIALSLTVQFVEGHDNATPT